MEVIAKLKVNKNLVMVILIVFFFIIALYFFPSNNEEVLNEADGTDSEEINKLKQEIEHLEQLLFEAEKFILASDNLNEYFLYPTSEIIYKHLEDRKTAILHRNDNELPENRFFISSIEPNVRTSLT